MSGRPMVRAFLPASAAPNTNSPIAEAATPGPMKSAARPIVTSTRPRRWASIRASDIRARTALLVLVGLTGVDSVIGTPPVGPYM